MEKQLVIYMQETYGREHLKTDIQNYFQMNVYLTGQILHEHQEQK